MTTIFNKSIDAVSLPEDSAHISARVNEVTSLSVGTNESTYLDVAQEALSDLAVMTVKVAFGIFGASCTARTDHSDDPVLTAVPSSDGAAYQTDAGSEVSPRRTLDSESDALDDTPSETDGGSILPDADQDGMSDTDTMSVADDGMTLAETDTSVEPDVVLPPDTKLDDGIDGGTDAIADTMNDVEVNSDTDALTDSATDSDVPLTDVDDAVADVEPDLLVGPEASDDTSSPEVDATSETDTASDVDSTDASVDASDGACIAKPTCTVDGPNAYSIKAGDPAVVTYQMSGEYYMCTAGKAVGLPVDPTPIAISDPSAQAGMSKFGCTVFSCDLSQDCPEVTIKINQPPVINALKGPKGIGILPGGDQTFSPSNKVQFVWDASDVDNDPLNCTVDVIETATGNKAATISVVQAAGAAMFADLPANFLKPLIDYCWDLSCNDGKSGPAQPKASQCFTTTDKDLLLWVRSQDQVGATAKDISGKNHDGFLNNATWTIDGLKVLKNKSGITINNKATELDGMSALSVSAYLKSSQSSVTGAQQDIVSKWLTNTDFTAQAPWETANTKLLIKNLDATGYNGMASDGRYVYYSPHHNQSGFSSTFLRYDTIKPFTDANSWEAFDPKIPGAAGFQGATFDGKGGIIYCAYLSGKFVRYDSTKPFSDPTSWSSFDTVQSGVDPNAAGYSGIVNTGDKLVFVPIKNGSKFHSDFLTLDLSKDFASPAAWSTFDPGKNGFDPNARGYEGGIYLEPNVIFSPSNNELGTHSKFIKYDSTGKFNDPLSWSVFDPAISGAAGFIGGATNGNIFIFAPYHNGQIYSGNVLSYDPLQAFTSKAAWQVQKLAVSNASATGYAGALFDGDSRIRLIPTDNSSGPHSNFSEWNSALPFTDSKSWSFFDTSSKGIGSKGYSGGLTFGGYQYFAPLKDGAGFQGQATRLGLTNSNCAYRLSYTVAGQDGALSGTPFGPTIAIKTSTGVYSASINKKMPKETWHMVTATYDGASLQIYLDGILEGQTPASGVILNSDQPVSLNNVTSSYTGIDGLIKGVTVFKRALTLNEVQMLPK